ncbi:MAG: hypothetical protein JWQ09_98, partial [Segetibacter sp.]|nr:hypothetical protein [Segetibacter sp.]
MLFVDDLSCVFFCSHLALGNAI